MFRSILFWLVASSGIAFFWPADAVGFNPFGLSRNLLWTLIIATMFSLGTLVRPVELQPLRSRPWWVGLGVAAQVLVMPLAAWLVTKLIPLDPELAAGVILCGCVPGAMASNVLTHTAGGSVAYSVSLTTVATLLSPITVPAVLSIVTGATAQSSTNTALILTLLVALPTVLGYIASQKLAWLQPIASRYSGKIASVALLWIIASVVASNRDKLQSVGMLLLLALLTMNLVGYAAGYLLGGSAKLPESFRRALSLEVGMQNAGLGTALAVTLYGPETLATIPTAAYTFGCMLTGTLLAIVWRRQDGLVDEELA
ncbi:bile acid:sodium symporter family protein [Planctomycetes bacterium K23_9]|uniref:Sodium Bile acid symporter family protein n=1 Tax=Stieleria marina TaxID=1930275 RepID=A0A517NPE5_9BACT|nr:Sodium Bile acid symporter family protein [Planctomycetes bacterium K23_9]